MAVVFLTPQWFFGYSVILQLIFAIITLVVSVYAFKIYRLTEQRSSRLLGFAFLFFSISYILQSVLSFVLLEKLETDVSQIVNLNAVYLVNLFGIYIHALFFIIGIFILTYMTLQIKDTRVFTLILSILLLALYFAGDRKVFMFYVLSTIMLIYTVIYYFMNYAKKKNTHTLLVLIAFICLLFSTLHFMFALNNEIYYVLGHVLELAAYVLIFTNLMLILKHGQKTR